MIFHSASMFHYRFMTSVEHNYLKFNSICQFKFPGVRDLMGKRRFSPISPTTPRARHFLAKKIKNENGIYLCNEALCCGIKFEASWIKILPRSRSSLGPECIVSVYIWIFLNFVIAVDFSIWSRILHKINTTNSKKRFEWRLSASNLPFALRGHVTSFLLKWMVWYF